MDLRERPTKMSTRYPWETVRARFFSRLLAGPLPSSQPVRVLDVGAGDAFVAGTMLDALPRGSSVTCVDSEYTEEHLATLTQGSSQGGLSFARACPDQQFDVIVLLDVLEHVPDDRAFLSEFVHRRLRRNGLLLVSVPAHQALYTQHDVALGHYRRYSSSELRHVVESAGLTIRTSGSLFGSLVLPRAFAKAIEWVRGIDSKPRAGELAERISTGISVWSHGCVVTQALSCVLELDAQLCELAARWSTPFVGLSVWVLCERCDG
jgi:SAM-dependent methyltransferase